MIFSNPTRALAMMFFVVSLGLSGYLLLAGAETPATPTLTRAAPMPTAWRDNIGRALDAARQDGRDVLLWFTGGGWTSESAVVEPALSSQAFTSALERDWVLVKVQISSAENSSRQSDAAASAWAQRLAVQKLPALVALDQAGLPFAILDALPADPAGCASAVGRMKTAKTARDAAFAQAAQTTGVDRAKHLERGLDSVRPFVANWYADTLKQILASDPDSVTGLPAKYKPVLTESHIDRIIQSQIYPLIDAGQYAAAIGRIDRILVEETLSTEQTQMVMAFKAQLQYTQGDRPLASQTLHAAISLSPSSSVAPKLVRAQEQFQE